MGEIPYRSPTMSKLSLAIATSLVVATLSASTPAKAENLEDMRQLFSSKQCIQCDLMNAGLILADLRGADLRGADLRFANLSQANLTGADLSGANLTGASLNGAILTGAILVESNFTGADLRNAYLSGATFLGTRFDGAYIQGTVGFPHSMENAATFYTKGMEEASRNNYIGAIENYNRALEINPQFASAYLGRGFMLYRLIDEEGAMRDVQIAAQLFAQQGNEKGVQAVESFIKYINHQNNPESGSGLGIDLLQILGGIGSTILPLLF
ncbi:MULTISPECIES: pentapeptide repeat-containing protein [Spirulina sp. CCY15215]|uniref:pentapeptide repeat-containing protein n=1 Tax=Spirulina sp. CCY15215 TaxID=2767591 RepID=UPI00194E238B|nr:pentapeptide repeat-containing protein [Spirulina major]